MKPPLCVHPCLLASVLSVTVLSVPTLWAAAAPSPPQSAATSQERSAPTHTVVIPGPLRSFLRMAGVSQKISQEEVLPLLARNVLSHGYVGWQSNSHPTEFLVLLVRYVQQARELLALSGADGKLHVSSCAEAGPLLHVLGYRLRQECGQSGASLITADPERAFLTIDSGFPLPDLEHTLQGGPPFSYAFAVSRVPVLLNEKLWVSLGRENSHYNEFLDAVLHDPSLARLYWAVSRNDAETRQALEQSVGLDKLLPFAAGMDLYGSHIVIRSGRVVVPGGKSAESSWKELVGASPEAPAEFVPQLLARDKGWLAAYYDALARVDQVQQAHFTQGARLRRFYDAFRAPDRNSDAARPMFRPAPSLLLLLTRVQWEANGNPHVPGTLDIWKEIFRQKFPSGNIRDWRKRSQHWDHPDQLLEAMFACSRLETNTGPLQIFLFLSDFDGRRPAANPLRPETVRLLAFKFDQFSDQYLVFSEFPTISDASIVRFVQVADSLDKLPNHTLRGNAMGIFQANVGLWQVLARQGQIPIDQLNDSWMRVVEPFATAGSSAQLYDAGAHSLAELLRAASGKPGLTQDEIVELLAGPPQTTPEGQRTRQELADGIRSVLDGQRLVSLDTIRTLGQGLTEMAQGKAAGDTLLPFAGQLREFEMPRPIFSSSERTEWAPGIYNNRHTDLQMKTDLARVIKSPASRTQLQEARGQLTPFLRDTLVGLNYAYYEPPGAQILRNNPLFVRSHDFAGETVMGVEHVWDAPQLFGQGAPAGGGAHLVGSLADLPYVLAEVEQDFIAPESVQSLIWKEMVPGLIVSATLPRWWTVSPVELHAVTLYQIAGEELLTASVRDEQIRGRVISILSDRMAPLRLERLEQGLPAGLIAELLPRVLPSDTFYLAVEFQRRFPADTDTLGPAGQELQALARQHPADLTWDRLSHDFGVPHPILAQTYERELINVQPFPAMSGYSSRLLSECWDSSNLYWARLADEMNYSPVLLNRLVPQLTYRMVEKIAATDLEDWPAILRALRETGDEFKQGKIAAIPSTGAMTSH